MFGSRSIKVLLPDPPPEYKSLPHWLYELSDIKLKKLLEQGDSQRVRELSLALITVLNEVGESPTHSNEEWNHHPIVHQLKHPYICLVTVWAVQGGGPGFPSRARLPSQSPQQHHQSADGSRPDHRQRHPADLRCVGSVHGEQDEREARGGRKGKRAEETRKLRKKGHLKRQD